MYGGVAAILLAFADGLISGARAGKMVRTILFSAAVMGCSQGSVKTHCSRAVAALAAMLKAKGVRLVQQ